MAKDTDQLAGARDPDSDGGLLPGLLAEERDSTRRVLWRLGSWAMAAVGAVMVAVIANQSSLGWRREQLAAADLARQAQQLQELARERQNEMRRLTSTIETLGNDRDRLSSRVTVLEQGLESITGAIARQNASATAPTAMASKPVPAATTPQTATVAPSGSEGPPAPQNQGLTPAPVTMPVPASAPATMPVPAPVATAAPPPAVPAATPGPPAATDKPRVEAKSGPAPNVTMTVVGAAPIPPAASSAPAPPLVSTGSMMGPPDPAASKMTEAPSETGKDPAAAPAAPETPGALPAREAGEADANLAKSAVQRTEFAIDLGSASSIGGLRALWRGILKSNGELASLHPIIVVRESNTGLGMQLRLAAGPLQDAAAAAKICAALSENDRRCETTVFDGQRLAVAAEEAPPATKPPPVIKPMPIRHGSTKQQGKREEAPAKQETSLSSFFSSSNGAKH